MAELFGDYLLLKRLARGSWSELWIARPRYADAVGNVVVKRLLPAMASHRDAMAMLEGEGRIASRLHDKHVVTSSAAMKTDDGQWYLVQPYVAGTNLAKLVAFTTKVRTPIPLRLRVFIVAQAAQGLSHAHTRRNPATGEHMAIIHRDVTPANLLVGLDGRVRVTDFGIAQGRGRKKTTRIGQTRGTLAYMSPEQAAGAPLDPRVDIYALGVVFWELLAGRRLYPDAPDFSMMTRIVNEVPPPPSEVAGGGDSDLDAYAYRCLQKDRDDRFAAMTELSDLLYDWLDAGEPELEQALAAFLRGLSEAHKSGAYRVLQR